jgi:hypothetical protein
MKRDGLVVRIPTEIWGVVMVVAGTIAALFVLGITRN